MAMFKRVLESLSKSLGGGKSAPAKPLAPPAKPAPAQAAPPKPGSLIDKVGATAKPPPPKKAASTPEEMCGISPKMSKEQIGAQLKLLYRRYNRGASSLDKKVSEDAERMLDAIVAMREKTFGEL